MKKFVSTVTRKGQVTLPSELRRHLHLDPGDTVTFLLKDDGTVSLEPPLAPEPGSNIPSRAAPNQHMDRYQMEEIAREDRFDSIKSEI